MESLILQWIQPLSITMSVYRVFIQLINELYSLRLCSVTINKHLTSRRYLQQFALHYANLKHH